MRKSSQVSRGILAALGDIWRGPLQLEETRYCVDEHGVRMPDSYCENAPLGVTYHWIYGGSPCQIGERVEGGSREPAVSNPGFGSRRGAGS